MASQAKQLKDLVTKLAAFRLDHTEYTCLKALLLFKPGKNLKISSKAAEKPI